MPIYEYECTKCHDRFEKLQRFSDPPVSECPVCGGAVSQLLSAPAIQFKGSGWYVTDYAKKSGSPASSAGNGKNGGEKSAATAVESTAAKSEPKSESKSKQHSKKKN